MINFFHLAPTFFLEFQLCLGSYFLEYTRKYKYLHNNGVKLKERVGTCSFINSRIFFLSGRLEIVSLLLLETGRNICSPDSIHDQFVTLAQTVWYSDILYHFK